MKYNRFDVCVYERVAGHHGVGTICCQLTSKLFKLPGRFSFGFFASYWLRAIMRKRISIYLIKAATNNHFHTITESF